MGTQIVGSAVRSGAAANALNVVGIPTGVADGDTAFAAVTTYRATTIGTVSLSGWTEVYQNNYNTKFRFSIFRKTLTASEAGGTQSITYTGGSGAINAAATVLVVRDAGDIEVADVFLASSSSNRNVTYPSLTPTTDDGLSIAFYTQANPNSVISPAAGWTDAGNALASSTAQAGIHYRQYSGGANTATGTQTVSNNVGSAGLLYRVSVKPLNTNVNAGYVAQVATATAVTPGGTAIGNVQRVEVSEDTYANNNSVFTTYGTDSEVRLDTVYRGYFKFGAASGTDVVVKEELVITPTTGGDNTAHTIQVYRVDADWTESTLTANNMPVSTLIRTVTVTPVNGQPLAINIAGANAGYGVRLVDVTNNGSIPFRVASSEAVFTTNRPYARYQTTPQQDKTVNAAPATASALVPEPSVDATDTVSVGATPATASLVVISPVVSTEAFVDATVVVETATASVDVPQGSGFSEPVTVAVEPAQALAEALNPEFATTKGVNFAVGAARAVAALVLPTVNGQPIIVDEAEDAYFQRVFAEFPKAWMRLNDRGSVAVDRMGNPSGSYNGVQPGRVNGPDNRHSVYFDGTAFIEQAEPAGTNIDEALLYTGTPQSSLEFSFKTTKENQFIMVSRDASQLDRVGGSQTPSPAREVYLRNGKIAYRTHYFRDSLGNQRSPYEFTGFKNLADGEWHSVVVKGLTDSFGEKGVEIWVDGKFEIRRTQASGAGELHGFPDFIGSRPASVDGVDIGALPSSQNFVGEMSEVVFYSHLISNDAVARHYYDFMAWKPVEVEPAEAFAFTTAGNGGRGNQKRALALYFNEGQEDGYTIGGDQFNNKMNFNPFIGFPDSLAGYKMFYKSVDDNNGNSYRDAVTDAPTLLSLKNDLDIDDYDAIMFKDWPDEGPELDSMERNFPGALARLVEELHWARSKGVGLHVTHPRLTVDLGIVDRVEFVETLRESASNGRQGNALGNYDFGSAVKFPWNIVATAGLESNIAGSLFNGDAMITTPSFLENKAFFYADQNFNNKFRVRALIEGLTDIPSYMISDAAYHTDFDPFGWQSSAFKYLHRYDGLRIGDEFIFAGTNVAGSEWGSYDYDNFRVGRPVGYFATPLANVKAGTVVTTFGATHWRGKENVENPYKDYATTIVVGETDVLNGITGGRIYVNFTEQPSRQSETIAVQVLPESNEDFPNTYKPDTAAQREWEWSDTRKTLRSTQETKTTTVNIILPNGDVANISAGGGGDQLTMTRSSNLFPIEYRASWQMNRRGLYWLGERADVDPGAAVVAVAPATASVVANSPSVVAQRDAVVVVPAVNALAVATKVAEDTSGDADIRTLPATATVSVTGFGRTIQIPPATATAEFVDNLEIVKTTGEQIVLYLHGVDEVSLYLKEET